MTIYNMVGNGFQISISRMMRLNIFERGDFEQKMNRRKGKT
jgi:hypothetical protein